MTGGEILIDGNAGNEIGHTMRRGLIAIKGDAGDGVGFNMIAGTILVLVRPGFATARECDVGPSVCWEEIQNPISYLPSDTQAELRHCL